MEHSAFAYVRKFGMNRIIMILLIMLPMFGLQIMMYQLPKLIIDDANAECSMIILFLL